MTRTRYQIYETECPYFMTCTVVGWLPVFTRPDTVNIVFDSWRYLQQHRGFKLYGYVILENHLHLIASAPELAKVMKSFKMYSARQVLGLLEQQSVQVLLRGFRALKLQHKTASEFQVWQEGNHPKQILNDPMMLQKLEYIHNNPVKRGFVDDPVHWRYSSARNYAGLPSLIDVVTDWTGAAAETEFRGSAFPNRSLGTRGEGNEERRTDKSEPQGSEVRT